MNTFSAIASVKAGWELFRRRPGFFVCITLGFMVSMGVLSYVTDEDGARGVMALLMGIASFIVGVVVEMFLINLALAAHDRPEAVQLSDGTSYMPAVQYAAVKVVTGVAVIAGLILLIVPGILAILSFMFSNYLVVDKKLTFGAAMKESLRITRPHWAQLFLLLVILVVMNVLGALLLYIGLLVTIPVSMLTMVHAYRTIERPESELIAVQSA